MRWGRWGFVTGRRWGRGGGGGEQGAGNYHVRGGRGIPAARIKVQAATQRRDELGAARRRGLAARHANKLRRLAEQQRQDDEQSDDGGGGCVALGFGRFGEEVRVGRVFAGGGDRGLCGGSGDHVVVGSRADRAAGRFAVRAGTGEAFGSGVGAVKRSRRFVECLARVRSELMDAAGLGLLATAAFTWSTTAGFVAAGLAVLGLNWRLNEGAE